MSHLIRQHSLTSAEADQRSAVSIWQLSDSKSDFFLPYLYYFNMQSFVMLAFIYKYLLNIFKYIKYYYYYNYRGQKICCYDVWDLVILL